MNERIARDIELHLPLRPSRAAVVKVTPAKALTEGQRVQIARIPGVCPKENVVFTPFSVAAKVQAIVARYTGGVLRATAPADIVALGHRELDPATYMPREARPGTKWRSFQTDGLQFAAPRAGTQFWWACVDGRAEVSLTYEPGPGRAFATWHTRRLEDLYHRHAERQVAPGVRALHPDNPIRALSLTTTDGEVVRSRIEAIKSVGTREVWRVVLCDGTELRTTPDHVFITPAGELPLSALRPGMLVQRAVASDLRLLLGSDPDVRTGPVQIYKIEPDGRAPVYDLILEGPHHNFLANGIAVHNCGAGKSPLGIVAAHQGAADLIVIVTKVDARPHYRTQVQKFTTTVPYIYGPDAPETKREPFERYIERCKVAGVRALVVTGYEGLKGIIERLKAIVKRLRLTVSVVFDEVHKAAEARREYKVLVDGKKERRRLGNIADVCEQLSLLAEKRIATSRTPMPDRRRALWSVIELTNPGEFGGSPWGYAPFALRYCGGSFTPEHGSLFDKGKSNTDELKARLAHYVHVVHQAELQRELPPLTRQVRYIPSESQNGSASVAEEMKDAKRARDRSRAAHVKLLQICSRKRDAIVEIVEEAYWSGKKVLILTGRQREVVALRDAICERLDLDPERCNEGMDTDTPIWTSHDPVSTGDGRFKGGGLAGAEERERRRLCYMDDPNPDTGRRARGENRPAVFIGTLESTGESKDFQDTDILIFGMLSYRPKDFIQGEGRGGRIGQTRPLLVIYLICEGTSEEGIAVRVIEKMADVSDLMGDDYLRQMSEDMKGLDDPALENVLVEVVLQKKKGQVESRAPEAPPMADDWEPEEMEVL